MTVEEANFCCSQQREWGESYSSKVGNKLFLTLAETAEAFVYLNYLYIIQIKYNTFLVFKLILPLYGCTALFT